MTNASALRKFNRRADLQRPKSIPDSALESISFYAFSRMYDVCRGRIVQKRMEKMVALIGNGWPAQAKRSHKLHEEYAKKTLYAYMPCEGLAGTEYIDEIVRGRYGNRYGELLLDFVNDRSNKWCPKWIRRNYEIQNKSREDPVTAPATIALLKATPAITDGADGAGEGKPQFPHGEKFKVKFSFEPSGEPPAAEDPEKPENPPGGDHWSAGQRPSWQRHSEQGPNVEPEGKGDAKPPLSFEELVNPLEPPQGKEYDRHWTRENYDQTRVHAAWQRLREDDTAVYSDETLSRETLNDDYQQLFVAMLLDHVQHLVECIAEKRQPEPLRLLLLGTAGSGKTRAVQTALQEIQRALAAADLPVDIDPREFVRVAACTGR